MKKCFWFLVSLFLFSVGPVLSAEPPHVHAVLISEQASISNKPFWVAVKLTADQEWHTYWKNPGDSGMATRIKWDLPPGFAAEPFLWPTPERIEAPPLASFGYVGETYFLARITPPAHLAAGPVTIKANVNWLECKEACYPGKATLEKTLTVSGGPPTLDPKMGEIFSRARFAVPLVSNGWQVSVFSEGDQFSFGLTPPSEGVSLAALHFFPDQTGLIDNFAPQALSRTENGWRLDVAKSPLATGSVESLSGVLSTKNGWRGVGSEQGWQMQSKISAGAPPGSTKAPTISLLAALLLAFIGGLILNIMPCVLPVLSLKILGLARQPDVSPLDKRRQAGFYGLGVLLTFWILAGSIFLLKAGGHHLGWGFQLQSPAFVSVLIFLFYALTLNLFGVFEIGTSLIGVNVSSARGHAVWEPLSSGILAAVVATPCTAPFMGAALGFALASPPIQGFLVFTSLGIGMALPFMLLVVRPKGLALLPRPGPWMNALKRIMGLLLLATTAWLAVVLAQQDAGRLRPVLWALLPMGAAAWIYGRIGPSTSPIKRKQRLLLACVLTGLSIWMGFHGTGAARPVSFSRSTEWEPFSQERVQAYRTQGRPVFIDFTASWCLTCQVNQRVTLDRMDVQAAFKEKNVALLKADWTNQDDMIAKALEQYGRSGVPTYVLIPADPAKPFKVLPEVLTPGIVLEALKNI